MDATRRRPRAAATLLRKLRSLASLDGADRRRLLRAMVTLCLVSRSLRGGGLQRCQDRLRRRFPRRPPLTADAVQQQVTAWEWAVRTAARNVPCRARCLEQSLTLWYLLGRRGVASELRIGVRKAEPQTVEAHAWVEIEGVPINDRADIGREYAAFDGPLPSTVTLR